jgi:cyclomaltodextrin glucanotransferase
LKVLLELRFKESSLLQDEEVCQVLEYINSNTWFGEIPFNESAGKAIAYKYAIIERDEYGNIIGLPLRENLVCRHWLLSAEGTTVKWRDRWNS